MSARRSMTIRVAGISYCQGAASNCSVGDKVTLIPEPNNQYDRNAVRVDCNSRKIGYLPREIAREVLEDVTSGRVDAKVADVLGGGRGYNIGVQLHLSFLKPPAEVLANPTRPKPVVNDKVAQYEKVARINGDAQAMLALGDLYKNGDGVEKNDVKATEWYHQATVSADDDFRCLSDALANLGDCYYDGRGVQQDKERAADYYLESQLKYRNWIEGLKPSDDVENLKSIGNIRAKVGMFKTHSIQMKNLKAQNQKWRDERALADKEARKAETRKKVKEAGIGFGVWLFYGVVVLPILIFLIHSCGGGLPGRR